MGVFSRARPAPLNLLELRRGEGAIVAVGEQYHSRELKKAWKLAPDPNNIVVALVPEPGNTHDKSAVRLDVLIYGTAYTAGYVGQPENRGLFNVLEPLAAAGITGFGYGKIRMGNEHFEVYARLSEDPARLVPPQVEDPIGEFVDGLYDLTVTGEEQYQGAIEPYARSRSLVFAMHPTVVQKGKYKGERTFAVYLNGQVVGEITRAMAEKHGSVFDAIFSVGRRPYLAGRIEKDHRGFQVILEGPRRWPGGDM